MVKRKYVPVDTNVSLLWMVWFKQHYFMFWIRSLWPIPMWGCVEILIPKIAPLLNMKLPGSWTMSGQPTHSWCFHCVFGSTLSIYIYLYTLYIYILYHSLNISYHLKCMYIYIFICIQFKTMNNKIWTMKHTIPYIYILIWYNIKYILLNMTYEI